MTACETKPVCLLFGGNGQLGHALRPLLAEEFTLHVLQRADCDVSDTGAVAAAIKATRPTVIINATAYNAVDKAESEPERAMAINCRAVATMAEGARHSNAALLHYSTDYVFDGSGQKPWHETDTAAPLNAYGRSKLAGEQAIGSILDGCDRHWIIRTSWVFGRHGSNFLKTILRLACERDQLTVVDDQVGAPTSARLLAETSIALLDARPPAGLYHLAAAGETSWYGYARHAIEYARGRGMPVRLAPEALQPIPSAAYPSPAARPKNSRLHCGKIERTLSIELPDWRNDVQQVVDQLVGNAMP